MFEKPGHSHCDATQRGDLGEDGWMFLWASEGQDVPPSCVTAVVPAETHGQNKNRFC